LSIQNDTAPENQRAVAVSSAAIRGSLSIWLTALFTFVLVCFPIYIYYRRFRLGAALSFLAADTFYYLSVARNSMGISFYSFDGVHPTNGFHPLWQYLLAYIVHFKTFSLSTRAGFLHIFLLDLLLTSVGYAVLSVFVSKTLRFLWLVPLAICPGLTWFIIAVANTNFLSAWSYVNGMETGLSFLFFGAALLCFGTRVRSIPALYTGAFFLGLAVLSRLDDVFFLIAFFVYAVFGLPYGKIKAALAYVPPFLMIATYVTYNRISVGVFLPVSGAAKFGLSLRGNLLQTVFALRPGSWNAQPFPHPPLQDWSIWSELSMRLFQLWFPILLCAGYLIVAGKRGGIRNRPVLACLCAGTVMKGLYNMAFVTIWEQGHWYYGMSIFTCNVVLALALDTLFARALPAQRPGRNAMLRGALLYSSIALFTWFCFEGLIAHKVGERYAVENDVIFEHGKDIANDIRKSGEAGSFLELYDGELAYASGIPSVSGIGLALDLEALKAKRSGHFLDLMEQRGIHTLVVGGLYQPIVASILAGGGSMGNRLGAVRDEEFARYAIEPVLIDKDSRITIYNIVKRQR
jgi:hypothetical protein